MPSYTELPLSILMPAPKHEKVAKDNQGVEKAFFVKDGDPGRFPKGSALTLPPSNVHGSKGWDFEVSGKER